MGSTAWQLIVPVIYLFTLKQAAKWTENIVYVIGSLSLSLLVMIFAYTFMSQLGIMNLLARISPIVANGAIVLMVLFAPVLVAYGYYRLERYKGEEPESAEG